MGLQGSLASRDLRDLLGTLVFPDPKDQMWVVAFDTPSTLPVWSTPFLGCPGWERRPGTAW